jgi:hypothetical protein
MSIPEHRPSRPARRGGYLLSILVNGAVLYGLNVWPGWSFVPFLTAEFAQVLDLMNVSLVVTGVANVLYLLYDGVRFKAIGDLVILGVGIAVLVQLWQVFPFDFTAVWAPTWLDWVVITRVLLAIALIGSALGVVAQLVLLIGGPLKPRRSS